jgi:pimeloyl-ACP methyl ester carboxylesterase
MTEAIVLLHALGVDARMWAALGDFSQPVYAVDQRGHSTDPPSLDLVADDLARFLDLRGVRTVTLAGCSMGGYVAMAFLRRHPGRARALALMATRATADGPAAAAERLAFADLVLDPVTRGKLVDAVLPRMVGATTRRTDPATVDRVRDLIDSVDARELSWSQRAIAARPDSTALLRDTRIPAVVIAGDEDELVSPEESAALAAALPYGEQVTVRKAGHLAPMEAPDAVGAALRQLIERSGAS